MSKEFDGTNKIEAYLRNELSLKERAEFEEHINQDPLLQNELTIQSEIISSLQNYRKVELKQRLNQIDVSAVSNPSNYLRGLGLAFIAVVLIGMGTFIYYNQSEETALSIPSETNAKKEVTTSQPIEIAQPAASQPPLLSQDTSQQLALDKTPSEIKVEEKENIPAVNRSVAELNKSEPTGSKAIRPENEKNNLQHESNDHSTKNSSSRVSSEKLIEVPLEDGLESGGRIAPNTEKTLGGLTVINNNSKYTFHYRYKNGRLDLLGDFSRGYKIIHLKNQQYFYFEDNFYSIDTNQVEITPLVKVVDETILEKLRKNLVQD